MKQPKVLQWAGRMLDPLIGKSLVLYFRRPETQGPESQGHSVG